MGARGQAIVAGVQAGISTAKEWWASLTPEQQQAYRTAGISAAKGWAMARRCRKGNQRASDICFQAAISNGNGNGNGNGARFLGTREERAAGRARRAEERRAARQVSGPAADAITMPRLVPSQISMGTMGGANGNGANGNGAQLWYQNPVVWAAGAAGAYLLWMRKSK